jgi:hypothetical protein
MVTILKEKINQANLSSNDLISKIRNFEDVIRKKDELASNWNLQFEQISMKVI